MAVVTLKYIRSKDAIKAHLRYITHRRGQEQQEKITRDLFNKCGFTDAYTYEFMKAGIPGGIKLAFGKKGGQKAERYSKEEEEAVHCRLSSRR